VELSIWDLEYVFTAHDAALLAVGADPHEDNLSKQLVAKAALIQREIEQAAYGAALYAERLLKDCWDAPPMSSDIWEAGGRDHELPSCELRRFVGNAIDSNSNFSSDDFALKIGNPQFSRDDLAYWLAARGIRPVYDFNCKGRISVDLRSDNGRHELSAVRVSSLSKSSNERMKDESSYLLASPERNTLLKQIAALSLVLAEKSNRYKRGGKPNALQIAKDTVEILDALPDADTRGVGSSSIRESIHAGIELLTTIKK
jgi:hypothetical protein